MTTVAIWSKRGTQRLRSESEALQRERLAAKVKLDAFVLLLRMELEDPPEGTDNDRPAQR